MPQRANEGVNKGMNEEVNEEVYEEETQRSRYTLITHNTLGCLSRRLMPHDT